MTLAFHRLLYTTKMYDKIIIHEKLNPNVWIFNSSMMDANTLVKSEEYDNLPESYVIFIVEHDIMGANLPVYHADRIVRETGRILGDGAYTLFM